MSISFLRSGLIKYMQKCLKNNLISATNFKGIGSVFPWKGKVGFSFFKHTASMYQRQCYSLRMVPFVNTHETLLCHLSVNYSPAICSSKIGKKCWGIFLPDLYTAKMSAENTHYGKAFIKARILHAMKRSNAYNLKEKSGKGNRKMLKLTHVWF